MIDVPFGRLRAWRHLPTTDGRQVIFSRHTQPENELKLLLRRLKLELPEQAPPRISAAGQLDP